MPRSGEGHINYALVEKSARLQRVVDLLKKADYPLSCMEIQFQAWVANASTDIAEIRSGKNAENGYMVSPATKWKGDLPWQDGKSRYWLVSAPGWVPRWTVTKEGLVVPYTGREAVRETRDERRGTGEAGETKDEGRRTGEPGGTRDEGREAKEPRLCRFQECRKPLPPDAPEMQAFCRVECKDGYWRLIREAGKRVAGL